MAALQRLMKHWIENSWVGGILVFCFGFSCFLGLFFGFFFCFVGFFVVLGVFGVFLRAHVWEGVYLIDNK